MRAGAALLALALLAACDGEDGAGGGRPPAVALDADAVSHFCQMGILEHPGPKGQIHLEGHPKPLFFSQVRDAVAFVKSPETLGTIRAVYVPDMGAAPSWDAPGRENWIAAETALFVVGSGRRGGMGAPEIVPFKEREAAAAFAAEHGGEIMPLDAIPPEAALGAVELDMAPEASE